MAVLEAPERFYTWHRKAYWTYWTHYEQYVNDFDGQKWHCWEEWAVFIGLKPKGSRWFGYEDSYYDGHTVQMVTFAGVAIGKLYSYDAQRLHGD